MSHGFMDGTGITPGSEKCLCGNECEFPCWQRIGIGPACPSCGCPPFHDVTCTDGGCDQCRQTERGSHQTPDGGTERPDSPLPSGGNREGEASQPRSVCLCDPDVDGYCDRECG